MDEPLKSTIGNFLKDYGTLLLAIYGVVQLWFWEFFKLLFRQPRVELYTANVAEIGYSNFGPTLGLYGTLRAVHSDIFISDINLTVTRLRDNAQHRFLWLAFRPNQFVLGSTGATSFELPSGFIITQIQPHRYNIIFSDNHRHTEMFPSIRIAETLWADHVGRASSVNPRPDLAVLYDQFVRSTPREIVDFHRTIQRLCYWDEGEYSIQAEVRTANPNKQFSFNRRFSLSSEDAERLRRNTFSILAEVCRQQNNLFNFSYPALRT